MNSYKNTDEFNIDALNEIIAEYDRGSDKAKEEPESSSQESYDGSDENQDEYSGSRETGRRRGSGRRRRSKRSRRHDHEYSQRSERSCGSDHDSEPDHDRYIPTVGEEIRTLILKIVYVLAAFFIVFTFIFGLQRNLSAGMQPSLRDGDLLFYYRLDKNYKANNVVVFEYQDEMIASRVVAVAGDTVNISEEGLEINGSLMYEPEIYSRTTQFKDGPTFPLTVEEDTVFVLGDNREHANDSRIIGLISKKDIKGKVMGVIRRRNI